MSQNLSLAKNPIIDRIGADPANEKSIVLRLRKKPRKEEESLRQELGKQEGEARKGEARGSPSLGRLCPGSVGGKSNAWTVPASASDSLNHWAEKSRFLIGDSLVWEYVGSKDAVLQVTKRDYVTCNTSSPIETYTGGSTKVKLVRSGPYYFISGGTGHCEKGQKLIVVVLSEKYRSLRISPAPSPVEIEGPAIAPAPANGARSLSGAFLVALLGVVLVAV